MPQLTHSQSTPYSSKDLFDLVKDIESYPSFLPYCCGARIKESKENIIIAELMIKYKFFRSSYISKVTLLESEEIIVELVDGPFKYLSNHWRFIQEPEGSIIEFKLDFELKSSLLESLVTSEFDRYATKLMQAFLKRAKDNLTNKV